MSWIVVKVTKVTTEHKKGPEKGKNCIKRPYLLVILNWVESPNDQLQKDSLHKNIERNMISEFVIFAQ